MIEKVKSCPCEYEEVEPCHYACTCRNPVMSGGCQRCCRYGRVEQRVARAKRLVLVIENQFQLEELVKVMI